MIFQKLVSLETRISVGLFSTVSRKMSSQGKLAKPNILISANSESEFSELKVYIQHLLGKTSYTMYSIDVNSANAVWKSNCVLLVTSERHSSNRSQIYAEYLKQGGRIFSVPSAEHDSDEFNFEAVYATDELIERIPVDEFMYEYRHKSSKGIHLLLKIAVPILDENLNDQISTTLCDLFNLKRAEDDETRIQDKLEKYHIFSKNQLVQSPNVLKGYLEGSMNKKAQFMSDSSVGFDSSRYFEVLKTKTFGTAVLFSELVESTMISINELPQSLENIVVIARRQSNGQGNNKNEWLSPKGCCMFTLYINLSSKDFSPSRLSLLQFAAALACVKAVRNTAGYESLSIQTKWPNDVYFDQRVKLGGILVKSSMFGERIAVKIGVGVNLSNDHPTECLNKIFREHRLPEWSTEEFIGKFMNHFEQSFKLLAKSNKPEYLNTFLAECENNWIHKNQSVRVNYWNEDVLITGLNEHGYLRVKRPDGSEHCLQPDGNRFDLMENMILLRDS